MFTIETNQMLTFIAYNFCWNSNDNRIIWHIIHDNGTCSNHYIIANSYFSDYLRMSR